MRAFRVCFALVWVLAHTSVAHTQARSELPPDLDGYIARVLRAFDVPGVSVAIVKDGRIALAKGYGVRTLGDPTRVDAQTLFGIASNTKLFTATALGLLVEEGKLAWDAPVITYLPWFQMWDPYVTRALTIRDLLVHRSGLGLGAGDLLWCRGAASIGKKSGDGFASSVLRRALEAHTPTTTCCTSPLAK